MKKLFALFLLMVLVPFAFGQNYIPFIQTDRQWSELDESMNGVFTNYLRFTTDTTINGTVYKGVENCYMDSTMTNWTNYNCYVRETVEGKVYRIENGTEYLLYDFGLNTGDEFPVNYSYSGPGSMEVSAVDSVLINGQYRKRITFNSIPTEIWVEGIGSLGSTFQPFINSYMSDQLFEILCVNESGGLVYQLPNFTTCYIYITGINSPADIATLSVSPNPVQASITITLPDGLPAENKTNGISAQLEIYNTRGDKTMLMPLDAMQKQITLDVAGWPSGIYLIRLANGQKTLPAIKFMKK